MMFLIYDGFYLRYVGYFLDEVFDIFVVLW